MSLLGPVLLVVASVGVTPAEMAVRVVAASAEEFSRLAADDDPDPWLVADELCRRERWEIALRYSTAAPRPDVARLAGYVEARRRPPPPSSARTAIETARGARGRPAMENALERIEASLSGSDAFFRARLELERGVILRRFRRTEKALMAFRRARVAALDVGWLAGASLAFRRECSRLPPRRAIPEIHKWILLARRRGDRVDRARALWYLGNKHGEQGEWIDARDQLDKARTLLDEACPPDLDVLLRGSRGQLYFRAGNYKRALDSYEKALERSDAVAPAIRGELHLNIAETYLYLGDPARSWRVAEEALGILSRYAHGVALANAHLGRAASDLGRRSAAIRIQRTALSQFEALGDPDVLSQLATVKSNLARDLAFGGSKDEIARALDLQTAALEIFHEIGDPWRVMHALIQFAEIHHWAGDDRGAERLEAKTLELLEDVPSCEVELQVHLAAARRHLAADRYLEALGAARSAMGPMRELVRGLALDQSARARARHTELFRIGLVAASRVGDAEALCEMIERGRAGAFLESLRDRERLQTHVRPLLRRQQEDVRLAICAAEERLREARHGGNIRDVHARRDDLDQALKRQADLAARIAAESRPVSAIYAPRIARLERIQRELGRNDVLISYALPENAEAIAFVVTRKKSRIVGLGVSSNLERLVHGLHITPPDSDRGLTIPAARPEALTDLVAIRKALVEVLALDPKTDRVIVSPEGALYRVPWAAVFGRHEVTCVPSGSALVAIREEKREADGKDVLAVGNPDTRGRYPNLPGAESEARKIGNPALVGKAATRQAVVGAIGEREHWRAIHLACHAVVDPERPLDAYLALAVTDDDDGRMTALQALGIRIRAELVVLSACDTAHGKIYQAEGMYGLTRAFQVAGAPRVISSLWKVNDEATRALMEKFYELWLDGTPTAGALRAAQEHVRAQPKWKHPAYWAAWQLWGLPD